MKKEAAEILACPDCKVKLNVENDSLTCPLCKKTYEIEAGVPNLLPDDF